MVEFNIEPHSPGGREIRNGKAGYLLSRSPLKDRKGYLRFICQRYHWRRKEGIKRVRRKKIRSLLVGGHHLLKGHGASKNDCFRNMNKPISREIIVVMYKRGCRGTSCSFTSAPCLRGCARGSSIYNDPCTSRR